MAIRSGGPDDFDSAANIYFVASTARRDGRPIEDWRMAQVREEIANPEGWFILASDDGRDIGMAAAVQSRHDTGAGAAIDGLCYLEFVFVLPERWGEGIGSLLTDTMMAQAVERGFTRMHLFTHENNDRAHALYEPRGFVRTGRTHPSGNDPDILVEEWEAPL